MKKSIIISSIMLAVSVFFGCATMDAIKDKVASITGKDSESDTKATNGANSSASIAKASGTKIVSTGYLAPTSYEEAYSYRTDTAYKNIATLLRDKNTDALRATNPNGYVKTLCDAITKAAQNDFEKVKMAHDAVCLLISYDAKNFWAGTVPSQDVASVLKTKTAVCEGYANVFKKFCDTLGIQNEKITGYARGVGTSLLNEGKPTDSNHAWNIVKINNAWYLVDCTWDSGYMEGRISKQDYTTDWLFLKPEHFIYSHFPDNARKQLLATAVTAAQFSALPDLRPKFFEATTKTDALRKLHQADGTYQFLYAPKAGYELSFRLVDAATGREQQNCTFVKTGDSENEALFSFPNAGTYSVTIFWKKIGANTGHSCGEFLVQAANASAVRYLTTFSSSAKNVQIISPIESPLQKGKAYSFAVKVANKKNVAVICGRDFMQLTNDGTGLFTGEVIIPASVKEVSLAVADSERARYESLAKYSVK